MNRILVPAAIAALLAGCGRPAVSDLQSDQPYYSDSYPVARETTYVVREVPQEVPVYYADTVYMEGEPQPPEVVYVEEVYESETYVFVSEEAEHHHRRDGSRRRGHEPGRRGDEGGRSGRGKTEPPVIVVPPKPDPTSVRVPQKPPRKTTAPASIQPVKSPDKPTPPDQPVTPEFQAPAKDDDVVTIPGKVEKPRPLRGPARNPKPAREPAEDKEQGGS